MSGVNSLGERGVIYGRRRRRRGGREAVVFTPAEREGGRLRMREKEKRGNTTVLSFYALSLSLFLSLFLSLDCLKE
jgi:hypothetical protein